MLRKKIIFSFLLLVLLFFFLFSFPKNEKKEVYESLSNYELNSSYNEMICKNILIIDKINLKKCMNVNDVDKDIAVLYDDKTLVLAAHSGTAFNAYFKNLYKLNLNDEVIFYHNKEKNTYYVTDIGKKKKKDKLEFSNIENQLILITCSYNKKDEQIIYFLQK
ncbi:MAG: sortase [Bacilli bacterium]